MSRRVVAVVDWGSAALLKENVRFLHLAAARDGVRPRGWDDGSVKYRSLVVREDGSCELQRFSTVAVTRRLGEKIVRDTARKARMSQRG